MAKMIINKDHHPRSEVRKNYIPESIKLRKQLKTQKIISVIGYSLFIISILVRFYAK